MFDWAQKLLTTLDATTRETASSVRATPAMTGPRSGFIHGTHVVSNLGWRPVETLTIGDQVLSFDNGMQPIISIQRDQMQLPDALEHTAQSPVLVPEGALRNRRPIWLLPDQGLLVESDIALEDLGDPFAVVPAKSLAGHRGICLNHPETQIDMTTLVFQQDEVIYLEGGMLAHCPLPSSPIEVGPQIYPIMPLRAAKFLIACHMDADEPQGLTYHPEELLCVLRRRARTDA